MKKIVLKLDFHDDADKKKAIKAVSKLKGIDSIAMDMKDMKMTVIGEIDPVTIVSKLRKLWSTQLVSVGPAKEPEKKKEDGGKKDGGGGGGNKKKNYNDQGIITYFPYPPHVHCDHLPLDTGHYYANPAPGEENINGCVIC